ncbi:hypothetical protein ACMA1I_07470 [Pontibacter sp. 13R65]|uniref:hypothetical protein n=1 Tax=Pontibacter sp. 13R65 TaxID=3127458 RepID=UPI00301E1504
MIRLTLFLYAFLTLALPSLAQEPTFTWGTAIDREPREFENMHVVGISQDSGFYAIYTEEGKATLERYNYENQRMWATALLPRSTDNQATVFQDAVVLQHKVFMISTRQHKGTTTVFAQEITANGNYVPQVHLLLQAKHAGNLLLTTSRQHNLLLATLYDPAKKVITASLLSQDLKPQWSKTFATAASSLQAHLLDNGTAYVLAKSLPAAPSTKSFMLYRLHPDSAKPTEIELGHEQHRLQQASLTTTAAQDVVVAGYYSSGTEASASDPVLTGTFYYRFQKDQTKQQVATYAPFNKVELAKHNRYRQETDSTKWLRSLKLRQLVPVPHGDIIILGEVTYSEGSKNSQVQHTNDVLAVMLETDGTPYYTTSIFKKQASPANNEGLGSFLATNAGNYLQLLYIDFEYNFTDDNKLIIAGENSNNREPVLITVMSNGEQQVKPLHQTKTGREQQQFYLRPTSAYPVSEKEFIVLGIGLGYYKYGRIRFK